MYSWTWQSKGFLIAPPKGGVRRCLAAGASRSMIIFITCQQHSIRNGGVDLSLLSSLLTWPLVFELRDFGGAGPHCPQCNQREPGHHRSAVAGPCCQKCGKAPTPTGPQPSPAPADAPPVASEMQAIQSSVLVMAPAMWMVGGV